MDPILIWECKIYNITYKNQILCPIKIKRIFLNKAIKMRIISATMKTTLKLIMELSTVPIVELIIMVTENKI